MAMCRAPHTRLQMHSDGGCIKELAVAASAVSITLWGADDQRLLLAVVTHYAEGNVTAFKAELMGIRLAMGLFYFLTKTNNVYFLETPTMTDTTLEQLLQPTL